MIIDFPVWLDIKTFFHEFVQHQAFRLIQGHYRYGSPKRSKKYMKRMRLELEAYEKTGNIEHLFNMCNYAILETCAPQNALFHFDNTVDSVTRGKV